METEKVKTQRELKLRAEFNKAVATKEWETAYEMSLALAQLLIKEGYHRLYAFPDEKFRAYYSACGIYPHVLYEQAWPGPLGSTGRYLEYAYEMFKIDRDKNLIA